MSSLRHKNHKNGNTSSKIYWYNYLIDCIPELLNKTWVILKIKFGAISKQTQLRIIVSQENQKITTIKKGRI